MSHHDPEELVYLECPNFSDALTAGVVFEHGRMVGDPIPRWRAENVATCFGAPMRIVTVAERDAQDSAVTQAKAFALADASGDRSSAMQAAFVATPLEEPVSDEG